MVVIRLSRSGANKRPFYHLVVADQRFPRGGRYIEKIGFFNPVAAGQDVKLHIELERANHWISQGAQPSDRVNSLLKQYQKEQAA
ncbi:MAG: ribosomal protein [Gammaproteobacteria bacterium]|jgi:small subunit ribosomal protein S16|nr:ribosomal protein [Gammaproteobacteria bacterium]